MADIATATEAAPAPAAADEKPALLSIEDVSINFGDFKAIKGVSTTVGENEIRFFIGPNGAGKTTMLDAICGKNKVSEGRIVYKGEYDLTKMREYRIANLGIGRKFQAPSVFNGITILENMELAAAGKHTLYSTTFKRLSKDTEDHIRYVLDFIGLDGKKFDYPTRLSHGEKQWLEIGMLLAERPDLLLLDEPVAGMSRRETEHTAELLQKVKNECSVIVVEHDMQFAKDVSDKVTVFHEGRVLDEGTMDDVSNNQQVIDVYLGRGGEA
ncbi:urea ABC transporter ATP-binding protein UrtD [Paratractidigestivibacter sp.]|uniref:urea ABC transporter ATP-binding protein UrtD n=1 Tax=Paratractidigestivibacter sp. TaxID=2847316 RepID=UPI002ABDFA03|nr:urea ABC transporter ATP-binding protein UrtD [Paratractidigestivibacter sp.]